jgi:hypothetical protein
LQDDQRSRQRKLIVATVMRPDETRRYALPRDSKLGGLLSSGFSTQPKFADNESRFKTGIPSLTADALPEMAQH